MMFFKTKRISIILLFIVSTMLIGFFSGCDNCCSINVPAATTHNELVEDTSENNETYTVETTPKEKISPPAYFEFFPNIEKLTEDEMYEIRDAWGRYWHAYYFNRCLNGYLGNGADEATATQKATEDTKDAYDEFSRNMFFDHNHHRYYGIVNNCIVLARLTVLDTVTTYTIGNNEIYIDGTICIYTDSKIFEIDEAYDKGYLTDNDISEIKSRHSRYNEAYYAWLKEHRDNIDINK